MACAERGIRAAVRRASFPKHENIAYLMVSSAQDIYEYRIDRLFSEPVTGSIDSLDKGCSVSGGATKKRAIWETPQHSSALLKIAKRTTAVT